MAKKTLAKTHPLARAVPYSEGATFGLHVLRCPHCGHKTQRLIRAHQSWRDQSDVLCPQLHVALDFSCAACKRGWQIQFFNEDEGGDFLVFVNAVETVVQEDAKLDLGTPPGPSQP